MAKIDAVEIPSLLFTEGSAPSTPASGFGRLYVKTTGLFFLGDNGVEIGPLAGSSSSQITYARKTADQTSTSTAFADVTSLTFAVSASTTYRYRFVVFIITSSTGEGYGLSVNGPTGTYKTGGILPTASPNAAGNAVMLTSGAAADTGGLTTNAGPAVASVALVEGLVTVGGSGGTLALRLKAETGGANSATVQAGSYGEISVIP